MKKEILFNAREKLWDVYVQMEKMDMDTDSIIEVVHEIDSMLCEFSCQEFIENRGLNWDLNALVDEILHTAWVSGNRQDDASFDVEVSNYREPSGSCGFIIF